MKKPLRNVGASVRERLLLLARSTGQTNGDLLDRYCIERFLHRLSCSRHRDRFVLKGAMLLIAWGDGATQRITRDADLLGFGDSSIEEVRKAFSEICRVEVPDDGVQFDVESIVADSIRSQKEYAGVRIHLLATLAGASVRVQVDVGFGDAVKPTELVYPSLLDLPRPRLRSYTREAAIAEKFEALTTLGMANTRMKDYFDLWHLSRTFEFEGDELVDAVRATFERRRTPIPKDVPLGLGAEFCGDSSKQKQWMAFWKKAVRREPVPGLQEVATAIVDFLIPVAASVQSDSGFKMSWSPGGPWRKR